MLSLRSTKTTSFPVPQKSYDSFQKGKKRPLSWSTTSCAPYVDRTGVISFYCHANMFINAKRAIEWVAKPSAPSATTKLTLISRFT